MNAQLSCSCWVNLLIKKSTLPLQRHYSLVFQLGQVVMKSVQLVLVNFVVGLTFQEQNSFVWERECGEKEGLDWVGEETVLWFSRIFVHNVPNDAKVNNWIFHILVFFSLGDESVAFAVSMREDNRHHTVHKLHFVNFSVEKFGSEDIFDKFEHNDVHFCLRMCRQPTLFQIVLPLSKVSLLQLKLIPGIKLTELFLIKFWHDSEARAVEEEIKLFVVFFITGVSDAYFCHFGVCDLSRLLYPWCWNFLLIFECHLRLVLDLTCWAWLSWGSDSQVTNFHQEVLFRFVTFILLSWWILTFLFFIFFFDVF